MTETSGILMEKVCYSISGRTILHDFDLSLQPGVNRTILGVSGVGKTTILKLILGLLKPNSGKIFIDGTDISTLSESQLTTARKHIAIVFQGGALFDSMTVGENVGYRLFEEGRLSDDAIESIILEKLSFVGLEKAIDLYPSELSGGMKKRVAIARALAADPRYIFFDEPTTGLDPIGVYNIQQLMLRLQREGKTTLMVTHDMPTAFKVSDRFSFIHEAELVLEGTKAELENSRNSAILEFFSPGEKSLFRFVETEDNDETK
jgi:phospholipid/cholesterol/gamma-HCH transport system ATP-binding protein